MINLNAKPKFRIKPKLKRTEISRLIDIFANPNSCKENQNPEIKYESHEYLFSKNFEKITVNSNQEKFKVLKNICI